jgi:hypothetical protein
MKFSIQSPILTLWLAVRQWLLAGMCLSPRPRQTEKDAPKFSDEEVAALFAHQIIINKLLNERVEVLEHAIFFDGDVYKTVDQRIRH